MLRNLSKSISCTIFVIYFYYLFEWLFFITKPSFMRAVEFSEKFEAFWICPIPLIAAMIPLLLLLHALTAPLINSSFRSVAESARRLLPAIMLGLTLLIILDTCAYTIFQKGLASTYGGIRYLGSVLLLILILYSLRVVRRIENSTFFKRGNISILAFALVLVAISGIVFVLKLQGAKAVSPRMPRTAKLESRLPNILLLGGDGLSATHLSAYDYARDTTPFMREFMKQALTAENAFPNGCTTTNSIPSLLTSKLPTETRVFFFPDVLRGRDSYEHLPGILKELGYTNKAITLRHMIDAYDLNFRNAFDESNQRARNEFSLPFVPRAKDPDFITARLLILQTYDRLEDRVLHGLGVRRMYDHTLEINHMHPRANRDPERISSLLKMLEEMPQPFFIHAHLMGTHGYMFFPREHVFSADKKQTEILDPDFYDDAVLDFDRYFSEIISKLKQVGRLNNTIIVLNSDHGKKWSCARTPLIIAFPNGEHIGRITSNVQHLDIAPTLLDYLGISSPDWMQGQSLLSGPPPPLRPIIIASSTDPAAIDPPFYSLASISALICQRMYTLSLKDGSLKSIDFEDHTAPCPADSLPTEETIRAYLIQHLEDNGYEIPAACYQ